MTSVDIKMQHPAKRQTLSSLAGEKYGLRTTNPYMAGIFDKLHNKEPLSDKEIFDHIAFMAESAMWLDRHLGMSQSIDSQLN